MNPYQDTVFNAGYTTSGAQLSQVAPFTMKYRATVYQGDTTLALRFQDSIAVGSGAQLPTGSIAYQNSSGFAVAGVPTPTASNCAVPSVVLMGNDQKTILSQKGNIAGGYVTLLPCTGYYRIVTTVYNTANTYAAGDFLTATVGEFGDYTSAGRLDNKVDSATRAEVYKDVIVGIADAAVTTDHFDLPSLRFTCNFIPPVVS